MDLTNAIATARDSAVAVMRYTVHTVTREHQTEVKVNIGWGSGCCVVGDRYVMTADHVVNGPVRRTAQDHFVVFTVPGNRDSAFVFPVTGFPVERPEVDLAVLELGACTTPGIHLPGLPVSFTPVPDGSRVMTMGFPAPEVEAVNIDAQGVYRGGRFFLKSHANEGIVSAQYLSGSVRLYEFNVGWHHGESGGLVMRLDDPSAVITVMQHYRNVKGAHGILPGPRRGHALDAIQQDLLQLGASIA